MPVRSPEHPAAMRCSTWKTCSPITGQGAQDEVTTYFGMRKVEVKNGQVLLNNTLSISA